MVEPLDAQNLLSRTPLVEKTAASQRDQAAQLSLPASQMERDAQHMAGSVEMQHQTQRTEDRPNSRSGQNRNPRGPAGQADGASRPGVTSVSDEADAPTHELDITV